MKELKERVMTPMITCIECISRRMRATRITLNVLKTFTVLKAL